jgi:hypothetical protein
VALIRHRAKKEIADMFQCTGFATQNANEPLAPLSFNCRDLGPQDVQIEILYCGVAIPTFIRHATNGITQSTLAFRAMKLSAG